MASSVKIDQTIPLTCLIEKADIVDSHVQYTLLMQRGPNPEDSWKVSHRYNDFVALHAALQVTGKDLPLPPKKLFGNLDKDFISQRQQQLQVYVNIILEDPFMSQCLTVKKFFDPLWQTSDIYDKALQSVSMFFRSERNWEVIEPLRNVGWRLCKDYFLVKTKDGVKTQRMLSWSDIGPLSKLSNKDRQSVLKLLPTLQHPYIQPVVVVDCNDNGGVFIRNFSSQGSLRDYICKAKLKQHYLKKYANPKVYNSISLAEIKTYGRQILEALKFLQSRGWPYGHLHTGNVLIEGNICKLSDMENTPLGLPSFYRHHVVSLKKIQTKESEDSYCFGRVLYEMTLGEPMTTATIESVPPRCIPSVAPVLEILITANALKSQLPTINDILSMPLFCDVVLSAGIEKPTLKIPSKLKEVLKNIHEDSEQRLREEQKKLSQFKRLSKAQAQQMSEEERKRRRKSAKAKKLESDSSSKQKIDADDRPIEEDTCEPTKDSVAEGSETLSRNEGSSQVPPPPPGPAPMPARDTSKTNLLNSISAFNKNKLKATDTNDRSEPLL